MCVQGHVEAFLQVDCLLHYAVVHASDRKCVCLFLCQDTVRSMHTGCCCHLQVSEETAERQVSHSAAQSACWCISAAFQVSPSSVCPDYKVMHINSVREMQPGFPNSDPAHTHSCSLP